MHLDLPETNWHAEAIKNYTYRHLRDVGIECKLFFHGHKLPSKESIDLIDISEWCNPWHQKVAKDYNVPIVCTTEEGSSAALKNYLEINNIDVEFMLSRIKHFIARSTWTKEMLASIGINNVTVIPYGADLKSFTPANKEPEPSFLYVGSVSRQKGVHHLIDAYLKIMDRTDWKLKLCVGEFNNDAELLNYAKKLAEKNSKINLVSFPSIAKLPEVYQSSTCFCMIQDFSSPAQFSNPCVWACCCGLPVISLDTGAVRDYVKNGENGFLCSSVEEIAEKMLEITEMDWKEMGSASRRLAENKFSPERIAHRYKEVVSKL